jgi:hypothetical protein
MSQIIYCLYCSQEVKLAALDQIKAGKKPSDVKVADLPAPKPCVTYTYVRDPLTNMVIPMIPVCGDHLAVQKTAKLATS